MLSVKYFYHSAGIIFFACYKFAQRNRRKIRDYVTGLMKRYLVHTQKFNPFFELGTS